MGARVFGQVPYPHGAGPVTADNFALVRVNYDVVCRVAVVVAALNGARSRFPNLDCAVFGARHHPFTLAVEGDTRNIARVAFKCEKRVGVCGLDIV